MAGYCDNFSMIDGDSSNFSMIDGGDEFKAFPGLKGDDGTTFYPHVSAEGVLSWTNDGGKPNPDPVNIKGTDGKSAYQAAVEAGFSGTEAEFNTYLSGIGDLTDLVDRKAGALIDTVSGAIASFTPDSTIDNLLGVSVAVEPVQDLHGQDSPWPAGGGKNLLPLDLATIKAANTAGTWSGNNYTYLGITFAVHVDSDNNVIGVTLSGTSSADWAQLFLVKNHTIQPGNYIVNGVTGGSSTTWRLDVPSVSATNGDIADNLSSAATGDCKIVVRVSGTVCNNVNIYPMIRLASVTDATFAPYSNLCPISGWSAVGIGNSASNLIDASAVANGFLQPTNGVVYDNQNWQVTGFIPARGGEYTLSWESPATLLQATICAYDAEKHYITGVNRTASAYSQTFSMPFGTSYIRASWSIVVSGSPAPRNNIRLNFGSADLGYTPFVTGNTYTITLGQTVYGGTLDAVNGTMTITHAGAVFDGSSDESWSFMQYTSTSSRAYIAVPGIDTSTADSGIADLISNVYQTSAYNEQSVIPRITGRYNIAQINVFVPATTREEFISSLVSEPLQVVYKLATPIEITLTPTQISTIAGQTNNVWADAGDVSVEYAADIKAYIDRLNQPIEEDMVANNLIASGKYFTVNNKLYLSTASIAAGAQIIPGHNCTETSLVEALNALNA